MSEMRWRDGNTGLARIANNSLILLLQGVMVLCPLLVLGLLWWGRNRGFDITDEGMYLLVSAHPEQVSVAATLAYAYLAPLYHLVGGDIGAFRVIGYALVVFSALTLWYGVCQFMGWSGQMRLSRIAGAGLTVSGALLIYVWFLPTPSYNLLDSVLVNLFAGALLTGLAATEADAQRKALIAWFIAGVAVGLCLFVKFPTAILLFLLACLGSLWWPDSSLRMRFVRIGILLAGIMVWLGFHLVFIQSPAELHAVFGRGLTYARELDPRYTTGNAITRIVVDSWHLLLDIFKRYEWIYLISGIAAVMLVMLPVKIASRTRRLDWMLAVLGGLLMYSAVSVRWYEAGTGYMGKIAPLVGGVVLLGAVWRGWRALLARIQMTTQRDAVQRRWLLVLLFLVCLPFVTAAGTNNPLYLNMVLCMAPWFAAIGLLFASPVLDDRDSWFRWVVPAFLVGLCSIQVFNGCLKHPYRLRNGLPGQTVPTAVGPAGSVLLLDPASSRFVTGLRQAAAACGLVPGSPVLAFYDIPGLVFAIGGVSPGIPWYVGHYPGASEATEQVLAALPPEVLKASALLITAPLPSALPDLNSLGLSFPKRYRECASFPAPPYPTAGHELQLWIPASAG